MGPTDISGCGGGGVRSRADTSSIRIKDEGCETGVGARHPSGFSSFSGNGARSGGGGAMPDSASVPVSSHFDAILECLDTLRVVQVDDRYTKDDVIETLKPMLENMLSTVMMHSFTTSMSVRGWAVE
jgi:hypothetical protein